MNFELNNHKSGAQVELIANLCNAIAAFASATDDTLRREIMRTMATANDNLMPPEAGTAPEKDLIGLRTLLVEYGLKRPQVAKLVKRCGFPAPVHSGRALLFLREEVERWARSQPNRNNLAIVLRLRRRSAY